jgi:ribonuclease P protein component
MLSSKSRLPYDEFHLRGYRTVVTPIFSIKTKKNSLKRNRLGVVIGNSSVKSAAKRNFWRRQVKSVFSLVVGSGFDVLVIFRPHPTLPKAAVFKKILSDTIMSLISPL